MDLGKQIFFFRNQPLRAEWESSFTCWDFGGSARARGFNKGQETEPLCEDEASLSPSRVNPGADKPELHLPGHRKGLELVPGSEIPGLNMRWSTASASVPALPLPSRREGAKTPLGMKEVLMRAREMKSSKCRKESRRNSSGGN